MDLALKVILPLSQSFPPIIYYRGKSEQIKTFAIRIKREAIAVLVGGDTLGHFNVHGNSNTGKNLVSFKYRIIFYKKYHLFE